MVLNIQLGEQLVMDMDLNPPQDTILFDSPACCPRADLECYNEDNQHGPGFDEDNPRSECVHHACPEVFEALELARLDDLNDRIYGTGQGI